MIFIGRALCPNILIAVKMVYGNRERERERTVIRLRMNETASLLLASANASSGLVSKSRSSKSFLISFTWQCDRKQYLYVQEAFAFTPGERLQCFKNAVLVKKGIAFLHGAHVGIVSVYENFPHYVLSLRSWVSHFSIPPRGLHIGELFFGPLVVGTHHPFVFATLGLLVCELSPPYIWQCRRGSVST